MSKYKITLGSDPEFMIVNDRGIIVPSCDLLPGTKEEPYELGNGCSIQVDNVMAELTVPPSRDPIQMFENICKGIEATEAMLPQGYKLLAKSSHSYTDEQLEHPTAKVFGCEPDYHPYGMDYTTLGRVVPNPQPKATNPNLRTCGGHIHICLTDYIELFQYSSSGLASYNPRVSYLSAILDLYLGLPSLFLDDDTLRRELYGKPGAFRYKPYGIEYRTLSNFWVRDQKYVTWVYDVINEVLNNLPGGYLPQYPTHSISHLESVKPLIEKYSDFNKIFPVITALNYNDKELAEIIVKDISDNHKLHINLNPIKQSSVQTI